jgi:FkbM family methyltransferase
VKQIKSLVKRQLKKILAWYAYKSPSLFVNEWINLMKKDKKIADLFFYQIRTELVQMAEDYPSVINNGYLHLEKTIELAHFFGLGPDNAIVDIGGADGNTSIIFSKAFGKANIYVFEPIESAYSVLRENVKDYPNIIAVNKGLGSREGRLNIHLAKRTTASSLFQMEKQIADPFFSENLTEKGVEEVEISTLDKELPADIQVNIIKIDVQGYELEVLRGGMQTLKRTDIVLLEMQNHKLYRDAPEYYDLDKFLRENDFSLYDIVPSIKLSKKLYEWDSIYVNRRIGSKYDT